MTSSCSKPEDLAKKEVKKDEKEGKDILFIKGRSMEGPVHITVGKETYKLAQDIILWFRLSTNADELKAHGHEPGPMTLLSKKMNLKTISLLSWALPLTQSVFWRGSATTTLYCRPSFQASNITTLEKTQVPLSLFLRIKK